MAHPKGVDMVTNETEMIEVSLTRSQLIVVAFLIGEFYRFMTKEGVSEVSIGYQEVADLVDKLTKVMAQVSGKGG